MCRRCDAEKALGQWVQFGTPWGTHRGIVEQVTPRAVLVRVPRRYAPAGLVSSERQGTTDEEKLDLALAYGGYPGYGYGYGGRWGYPGYGAWWGGWWWWWLAFAWIFWLAFLW
ncbi:MAG: hypothetical protein K6T78_00695 [Alicyclobacillus sp.]|nr:hypothetical protein [Alicyclobacillus sp.]